MKLERVTAQDLFGYNEALNESTGIYAYQVGERAHNRTMLHMQEHSDLFIRGGLEKLAERKRIAAQDRFRTEREEGKHNDLLSESSGFIALLSAGVTPSRETMIRTVFEKGETELGYPELVEVEHPSGDDERHLLGFKFPEGDILVHYEQGPGFVEREFDFCHASNTFQGAVAVWDNSGKLNLRASEVARIETSTGLLWQNPAFTPDGARHNT